MRFLLVLLFLVVQQTPLVFAQEQDTTKSNTGEVADPHDFFGLAYYYNEAAMYSVSSGSVVRINDGDRLKGDVGWLALVGRYRVALWDIAKLKPELGENQLSVSSIVSKKSTLIVEKSELASIAIELDQLRYFHLWKPLAELAKLAEAALLTIKSLSFVESWGAAIIIYSLLIKILLLPISLLTSRLQRSVAEVKHVLAPRLAVIKENFDGEEAHKKIMQAHKELGVGPFYSLKPFLSTLVQMLVLIATFNALGEMPQINGNSFFWIDNLAYPDSVKSIGFTIPFMGGSINLLPILMALASALCTVFYTNSYLTALELKRQKRNLYLMAIAFLILFLVSLGVFFIIVLFAANKRLELVPIRLYS